MKKNTLFYLLIFTILFALPSCATDPLLRSYIVGAWQPVKFGNMDLQKLVPDGDEAPPEYNKEDYKIMTEMKEVLSKKNEDGTTQKSTVEDFSMMISEANTSYQFRAEGIGARLSPMNPIQGKWQLNKKGTKLIIKDTKTKEQFVLFIDSLSASKMVATNKNLPNGLKVTYKKDK